MLSPTTISWERAATVMHPATSDDLHFSHFVVYSPDEVEPEAGERFL
jgi:hypothetical protein